MKPTPFISLAERELAFFFPGALRVRLQELLPEAHLIKANRASTRNGAKSCIGSARRSL